MTGATWKEIVMQAVTTVYVNPYLVDEIDYPRLDALEAIDVLMEVLPSTSERRIERALRVLKERELEPTVEDLQKLADKKRKIGSLVATTDEEMELLDAQILEMAFWQLNEMPLIDINPSYHFRD